MRIKDIKTAILASLILIPFSSYDASGQSFGYLMRKAEVGIIDLLDMSRYSNVYGTARSSAMAGAFTSLGADLSTMNINPAGLGMYRSSEWGATPSFSLSQTTNSHISERMFDASTHRGRLGLNNLGAAFVISGGYSRRDPGITLGISYNKLADFNYRSSFTLAPNNKSIADVFSLQLKGYYQDELKGDRPWNNMGISMDDWGAILGYKTYLIDPLDESDNLYWNPSIAGDAAIQSSVTTLSKGSSGEISLGAGANLNNVLYVGASVSSVILERSQLIDYRETYRNNNTLDAIPAAGIKYSQTVETSGEGANIKIGAIVRPTPSFRLGISFHSPTVMFVETRYHASMDTRFTNGELWADKSKEERFSHDYVTPARLLTGLSYTFGNIGIISADYERTWYNGIRLVGDKYSYGVNQFYKDEVKKFFRATDTFRIGAEIKPIPLLALRGGYSYSGSPLQDNNVIFNSPVVTETENISCGFGVKVGRNASLDIAYVYSKLNMSGYDLYYYTGTDNSGENTTLAMGDFRQEKKLHNIMASLSFKFR